VHKRVKSIKNQINKKHSCTPSFWSCGARAQQHFCTIEWDSSRFHSTNCRFFIKQHKFYV